MTANTWEASLIGYEDEKAVNENFHVQGWIIKSGGFKMEWELP